MLAILGILTHSKICTTGQLNGAKLVPSHSDPSSSLAIIPPGHKRNRRKSQSSTENKLFVKSGAWGSSVFHTIIYPMGPGVEKALLSALIRLSEGDAFHQTFDCVLEKGNLFFVTLGVFAKFECKTKSSRYSWTFIHRDTMMHYLVMAPAQAFETSMGQTIIFNDMTFGIS